jgi:hypothetical protein
MRLAQESPNNDSQIEPVSIDKGRVNFSGWASGNLGCLPESVLQEKLLSLASQFGTPVPSRPGGSLCDTLTPTESGLARPHSLSQIHGTCEFPLHTDMAHWLTPCRYVMLACLSPGSGNRCTLLLNTQLLPLTEEQVALLHSMPFRVMNGRNSFFSTVLSSSRDFFRFDPGCMTPMTKEGAAVLTLLSHEKWAAAVESVIWQAGKVIVVDNWRVLHGRGRADSLDANRKLVRVSII